MTNKVMYFYNLPYHLISKKKNIVNAHLKYPLTLVLNILYIFAI